MCRLGQLDHNEALAVFAEKERKKEVRKAQLEAGAEKEGRNQATQHAASPMFRAAGQNIPSLVTRPS